MTRLNRKAFTLIELLIVVAIIGVLAAIAVPNFLNAQMRAKIANVQAELRNLSSALEMYRMDRGMYPPWRTFQNGDIWPVSRRLHPLTTPISYMSSIGQDPFLKKIGGQTVITQEHWAYDSYDYIDAWTMIHTIKNTTLSDSCYCSEWRMASAGPDGLQTYGRVAIFDASNGLKSVGDLIRIGPRASYPCDDSLLKKLGG
ncbi:MAG: prepilin-type N-terminal cleavage/methylation domain-containing protein [Candidatus Omnitrophota bacterium]